MQPKILYAAPLKDFSGYASAARNYVRALNDAGCIIATRDLRYDGGDYKRSFTERKLASRDLRDVEIFIQQTTPNEMEPMAGMFNVGVFCWETDRIPQQWVDQLNKMQLVIVPCEENLQVVRRCGVMTPVEKVHYSCDMDKYSEGPKPFLMPRVDNHFKMLSICQFSKKKGVDPLLKAYLTEFNPDEPVVLILKVYISPNDGPEQKQRVQQLIQAMRDILRLKAYPPIMLIHEVMEHEDIQRLYSTADCYVLPSRGEGWGVPHFDALGYGLPTIATAGTGPSEFITSDCGWLVDSHLSPVCDMPHPFDFLYTGKENWHEPHVCDLQKCMRSAFELWKSRASSGGWEFMQKSAKERAGDFSNTIMGPILRDTIMKYYGIWKEANVH